MSIKNQEYNHQPISLIITSKLGYWLTIFAGLFFIFISVAANYRNYTYNKGFNLLFFIVTVVIIGLIYFLFRTIVKTTFFVKLHEKSLIVKRPFNRSVIIEYSEINKIDITYGSPLDSIGSTPFDMILIGRKSSKSVGFALERWKIDLREGSSFLRCIDFLSDKTLVTIHVHNLRKKGFSTVKTKARLE